MSAERELYSQLYRTTLMVLDRPYVCVYCGEPGGDLDHVPPVGQLQEFRTLYGEPTYVLAHACSECNGLLGQTIQPDILARIDAAKERLRRRYTTILSTPSWTDEELTHLRGWLRTYVTGEEVKRRRVLARLAFNGGYAAALALSIKVSEDERIVEVFEAALTSSEKRKPCKHCGGPRSSSFSSLCVDCRRRCRKCGQPNDRYGVMVCSVCLVNGPLGPKRSHTRNVRGTIDGNDRFAMGTIEEERWFPNPTSVGSETSLSSDSPSPTSQTGNHRQTKERDMSAEKPQTCLTDSRPEEPRVQGLTA